MESISATGRSLEFESATDDSAEAPTGEMLSYDVRLVQAACLVVIAVLLSAYTLYFVRSVMIPVAAAILLNFLLSPIVRRMHRFGLPNMAGAGLVIACFVAVVAIGVIRLQPPATEWLRQAPYTLPQLKAKLKSVEKPVQEIAQASEKVQQIAEGIEKPNVVKVDIQQPSFASMVLSRTTTFTATMFFSLTLLFFLLASGDRFLAKCVELMPTFADKRRIVDTVRKIQNGIGRYLGTVTLINIGLGVVIGVTLWGLGVPNALLWGVMAMLLNYVPFVGILIGGVTVFFVSLATFSTLSEAAIPALAYVAINAIEANLVTPHVLGRSMSMNPVAILLWLTAWGWLWGIVGAILAVPLLAMVKIACEELEPLHPIAKFIEA